MTNYVGLKLEDAKAFYAAMTDAQRVASMNSAATAGERPVSGASVGALWARRGVLGAARERGERAALLPSQRAAAWNVIDMVERDGFAGLDPRVPAQRTALVAMLDGFVTETIMTAADRTATLALLLPAQTVAQSLGFAGGVTVNDLLAARGQF